MSQFTATSRRNFLRISAVGAAGFAASILPRFAYAADAVSAATDSAATKPLFKISLAQWSLHKAMKAENRRIATSPRRPKQDYGIDGY